LQRAISPRSDVRACLYQAQRADQILLQQPTRYLIGLTVMARHCMARL
jgi:hypothetical protein